MKAIILVLLLSPLVSFSQKTSFFIKLSDALSQQIKGESTTKDFEKWIQATTIGTAGKNATQFSFTMLVSDASADLKRTMANVEFSINGQVVFTAMDPQGSCKLFTTCTIKMGNISVVSCNGCGFKWHEERLCYFAGNPDWMDLLSNRENGGTNSIEKYSWNAESNKEWVYF
jgi:type VI protein secretion system component Hcp